MIFANPQFFYLLLLLPFIALWQRRQRRRDAITYSALSLLQNMPKTWRQKLLFAPPLCFILALACLITCLARPQTEVNNSRQERQGIAIEMLIDVSSSMDFGISFGNSETTRMEVAKKVVEEFVAGDGKDLKGRPDDLIGIISFSRYADTICPMTLGHDALVQIVRDITINERPNEDGTNYGDAVALAAARLKSLEEKGNEDDIKSKVIVMLTDGENNCGRHLPLQAAALAREWGIRIYTISLQAKREPKAIQSDNGTFLSPPAISASDKILEKMAESTDGIFRTAHDFTSLAAVYKEIDQLEKTKMKAVSYTDYEDAFAIFALAALALLALQQILNTTILRVAP